MSGIVRRKFLDYSRDLTSLGNPVLLSAFSVLWLWPEWKLVLILLIALVLNEIICSAIKLTWFKPRPAPQRYSTTLQRLDAAAFPSIHSSRVVLVVLFLIPHTGTLVQQSLLVLFAVGVITTRVVLRKHDIWDVLGGAAVGGVVYLLTRLFM